MQEPEQQIKLRRDAALSALCGAIPYIGFLGVRFDRRGDELTGVMPFRDMLIGNPEVPALHGGLTASFLEITAIIQLTWLLLGDDLADQAGAPVAPPLPRTIDFSVDYLRAGLPRDAYARARVNRSGRRYASVHVEAWQHERGKLFAEATGHFLLAADDG